MSGNPIGATGVITAINSTPTTTASSRSAVEIDSVGLSAVGIQITGTYTAAGGLSGQVTVDGLTWVTLAGATTFTRQTTGVATATVTSAEQDVYFVSVRGAKKFRITAIGAVTGTAQISIQGADMGAGSSSSSGAVAWGAITGTLSAQTDLQTALDAASAGLSPVILGAGPTAITHAAHSNRGVSSVQALPTSVVFAVTATSGALDEDLVTIDNLGLGVMTASGAIQAPPGFKLWASRGESIIAVFNAAANKYYSKTPDRRTFGGEPSWLTVPVFNSNTISVFGAPAHTALNSAAIAGATSSAATKYGHQLRCALSTVVTTASQFPGIWIANTNTALRTPTAAIKYGFKLRCIGSINDAYATGAFAMGFTPAAPTAAEPSTLVNCILLGGDSTDANMQVMHNNAAGTCTKIDLGAGFPNHTNATNLYELIVDFRTDGVTRFCDYIARNLVSEEEVYGSITGSELPAEGVAVGPFIYRTNLLLTGTIASCHFGGFYAGSFA